MLRKDSRLTPPTMVVAATNSCLSQASARIGLGVVVRRFVMGQSLSRSMNEMSRGDLQVSVSCEFREAGGSPYDDEASCAWQPKTSAAIVASGIAKWKPAESLRVPGVWPDCRSAPRSGRLVFIVSIRIGPEESPVAMGGIDLADEQDRLISGDMALRLWPHTSCDRPGLVPAWLANRPKNQAFNASVLHLSFVIDDHNSSTTNELYISYLCDDEPSLAEVIKDAAEPMIKPLSPPPSTGGETGSRLSDVAESDDGRPSRTTLTSAATLSPPTTTRSKLPESFSENAVSTRAGPALEERELSHASTITAAISRRHTADGEELLNLGSEAELRRAVEAARLRSVGLVAARVRTLSPTRGPRSASVLTTPRQIVDAAANKGIFEPMSANERRALWAEREYAANRWPGLLGRWWLAVPRRRRAALAEARHLAARWTIENDIISEEGNGTIVVSTYCRVALECLDHRHSDRVLRALACRRLNALSDNSFAMMLPQLVQALKYETRDDTPLFRLLLRRGAQNFTLIGHKLFWFLQSEIDDEARTGDLLLDDETLAVFENANSDAEDFLTRRFSTTSMQSPRPPKRRAFLSDGALSQEHYDDDDDDFRSPGGSAISSPRNRKRVLSRFELLRTLLCRALGPDITARLDLERDVDEILYNAAKRLKDLKRSNHTTRVTLNATDKLLKKRLDEYLLERGHRLLSFCEQGDSPDTAAASTTETERGFSHWLDPDARCCGLVVSKCRVLSSKKQPVLLVLKRTPGSYLRQSASSGEVCVLYKIGDDLRQDALALQLVGCMEALWHHTCGLDLMLRPYRCVATGYERGVVELVRDAKTTAEIQLDYGRGPSGAFKDGVVSAYLEHHNQHSNFEQARNMFIRSCAGYCVATHVLGVGDRHADNIMVTKDGRLFHVDFGHFLGNFKSKFGIKRERSPFVFTPDMKHVISHSGCLSEGRHGKLFSSIQQFAKGAGDVISSVRPATPQSILQNILSPRRSGRAWESAGRTSARPPPPTRRVTAPPDISQEEDDVHSVDALSPSSRRGSAGAGSGRASGFHIQHHHLSDSELNVPRHVIKQRLGYADFENMCCEAYNAVRDRAHAFVALFSLMLPAGMAELEDPDDINYLIDQLALDLSLDQAAEKFRQDIKTAHQDIWRRVDNYFHNRKHAPAKRQS